MTQTAWDVNRQKKNTAISDYKHVSVNVKTYK